MQAYGRPHWQETRWVFAPKGLIILHSHQLVQPAMRGLFHDGGQVAPRPDHHLECTIRRSKTRYVRAVARGCMGKMQFGKIVAVG